MKIQHLILTAMLASSASTIAYAVDEGTNNNMQPSMPMMQGPQGQMPMGYPQGQPMNPMMMQHMMRMRQQNMQMMGSPENTATNTPAPQNMPMGNMMQHRQQMMGAAPKVPEVTETQNCPMKHRMSRKSARMEMMQQKQAMMQAHFSKVESHLANIEALLKQIAEKK